MKTTLRLQYLAAVKQFEANKTAANFNQAMAILSQLKKA